MAGPPGIDLDVSVAPCPNTWTIELEECVTSLTITPKGKLVAAATVDDKISVIDTETGELKTTLPGHAGGTNAVEFLSGVSLASCGEDGKARIWNIARSTCIAELEVDGVDADRTPDGQSITHLTVAPRGQAFAVAAGRTVIQFTIGGIAGATLTRPVRRTFPPLPSTVEALRYDAHSGNLLAAYNGGVTAWDMHRSEDSKQALDLPYDVSTKDMSHGHKDLLKLGMLSFDHHCSAVLIIARLGDTAKRVPMRQNQHQVSHNRLCMAAGSLFVR